MKLDLEHISFDLTPKMSLQLLKFNKLKKKIDVLKENYILNKDKELLIEIKIIQKEMNDIRSNFIKEFKLHNKLKIDEYLKCESKNKVDN